jgi:hypothetical protein
MDAEENLYVGSYVDFKVGTLYALDGRTGAVRWKIRTGGYPGVHLGGDEILYGVGRTAEPIYRWTMTGPVVSGTNPGPSYYFACFVGASRAEGIWPMPGHDPAQTQNVEWHSGWGLGSLIIREVGVREGRLRFEWTGAAVLQRAEAIGGPWEDVAVVGNTYSIEPTGAHQFFRLRER